jgi:signal transduction histidine kinase
MKIKLIAIIFTIFMFTAGIFCIYKLQIDKVPAVDIVDCNDRFYNVSSQLSASSGKTVGKIKDLENQYDCEILLKTDGDYELKLVKAMKENRVIFDYEENNTLIGKIIFSGVSRYYNAQRHQMKLLMSVFLISIWGVGIIYLVMIYYMYERPFIRLKSFAGNVAKGNLDLPLIMDRNNYFGIFTESFDLMRDELKKARESEYQANVSKKELVAELSHDMKTPVATMKATCEVMHIKIMQGSSNDEEKEDLTQKVHIIEKKADMMEQLIDNMFHATLEELNNLKVEPNEESSSIIMDSFKDQQDFVNIEFENEVPECLLVMDSLRLRQVIDNIINNSYKYANTKITVRFDEQDDGVLIRMRDYGPGVPADELPLITQKYFRGSVGKHKSGAGLGLFLSKYFMEKMNGSFICYNDDGFVVELFLKKAGLRNS